MYALPSLIHNLWLMKRDKPLSIISNPFTLERAKELCSCFSLLSKENLFQIDWITDTLGGIELFPVAHSTPTSGVKISSYRSYIICSSGRQAGEVIIPELFKTYEV